MCHLILMMPIIGLGVFLIWPLSTALPVYGVILVLSAFLYFVMIRALGRPVTTGDKGLLGEIARVTDMSDHAGHVRVHGEIWNAVSREELEKGNKVIIIAVDGMTLEIMPAISGAMGKASGAHCHN